MLPRSKAEVALVTDGFVRKGLAAIRSLGRRGVRVVACESTALSPGLLSRYAWRRVVHPPVVLDPAGFVDAIERACRRYRPSVILAMEEESLLALLAARERFAALGVRLPYADPALIRLFGDKAETCARAGRLGIEVPETWTDPRAAVEEARFPVVVKPRRGAGAFGVRHLETRSQLERFASTAPEGRWLVQERLRGTGLGVSLLYDTHGRLRAQFSHRRLREYPSSGGASTLRESAHLPEVEAPSRTLLESAGFVGPAMVEWKVDHRDGRAKLIEVNPRFWGSLAVAIRAGVDFPWLLYRSALGEEGAPWTEYPPGVRGRFFLPGDLMHFVERRDFWGLARSLWPGSEPAAPDDIFTREDLGGALGAILFGIPFVTRPEFRRFRRFARAEPAPC